MKILTLNFNLKGIGTYRRSFYFSRELARAGHDVTMVTVSRDSRYDIRRYSKCQWVGESAAPKGAPSVKMIEAPNFGHKWLPGWGSGPLDIALRVHEIRHGKYDAVYGFEYHPNVSLPVYLTRPSRGYRFVSDWCDWFAGSSNRLRGWKLAHRVDGFLEERIRRHADAVTVTSTVLRDRALSIGIPRQKILHIPEGAAADYIEPMDQKAARTRFGLPAHAHVLVAVIDGETRLAIRIFAEVVRRDPRALFLLVGNIPPDALALAEDLGVHRRILKAGWVSDADYPRYLACADVCIAPLRDAVNDRARWPAKILDYLSAGRPVVTNDVGEVGPLFRGERIGLLAPYDQRSFADVVLGLLDDPVQAMEMGAAGRSVMAEKWDWRLRGPAIVSAVTGEFAGASPSVTEAPREAA